MDSIKENPGLIHVPPGTRTTQVTISGGRVYTVREQNGADEDIVSGNGRIGTEPGVLSKYISATVVGPTLLSESDASNLPTADRMKLIFAVRILSFGPLLQCELKGGMKIEFNLNEFSETKEDEIPHKWMFPTLVTQPDDNGHLQFTCNGTNFRIEPYTGNSEIMAANLASENGSIKDNDMLRCRKFAMEITPGKYRLVTDFKIFTSSKLRDIKRIVENLDPDWAPIITIPAMGEDKNPINVPVIYLPEFFFPL